MSSFYPAFYNCLKTIIAYSKYCFNSVQSTCNCWLPMGTCRNTRIYSMSKVEDNFPQFACRFTDILLHLDLWLLAQWPTLYDARAWSSIAVVLVLTTIAEPVTSRSQSLNKCVCEWLENWTTHEHSVVAVNEHWPTLMWRSVARDLWKTNM